MGQNGFPSYRAERFWRARRTGSWIFGCFEKSVSWNPDFNLSAGQPQAVYNPSKATSLWYFPRRWADIIEDEARYADKMFNGFLMGKLLDSAIIGLICFVGTSLLGFTSAPLISVVMGVTNIIPFFGPFIGAIPCALLLLLENPIHCLIFLVIIVILQQVDGNFIGPKILRNTTGLSSFWVLFSILLFGGLWGVLGMIVGVPLFAVIYDIVRQLTRYGLRRHNRDDLLTVYPQSTK